MLCCNMTEERRFYGRKKEVTSPELKMLQKIVSKFPTHTAMARSHVEPNLRLASRACQLRGLVLLVGIAWQYQENLWRVHRCPLLEKNDAIPEQ